MATLGVQFAQSLVTALAAASLMLLAGLVLVRAVRAWSRSAGNGRTGNRVLLQPALVTGGELPSPIRPSAGVVADAPSRAPPTTVGPVRQQSQDVLARLRRPAE